MAGTRSWRTSGVRVTGIQLALLLIGVIGWVGCGTGDLSQLGRSLEGETDVAVLPDGSETSTEQPVPGDETVPVFTAPILGTVTFDEWCTAWGLTCPKAPFPGFPSEEQQFTAEQWKAAAAIASSLLNSPSLFEMTREELSDPDLLTAVTALELTPWYDKLIAKVDAIKWQDLYLDTGLLKSDLLEASTYAVPSGLTMGMEQAMVFALDPAAKIGLTGLKATCALPECSESVKSVEVTEPNVMNVVMDRVTVTGVPMQFVMDEMLGDIDLPSLQGIELTPAKIAPAIGPLLRVLNRPTRVISLDDLFFQTVSENLPAIIPAGEKTDFLYVILSALLSVQSGNGTAASVMAINQIPGSALKCELTSGDAKVTLDKSFGIKRIYTVDATTTGLEFYGVTVSMPKAFNMSIKLKRVEIGAEKITIRDIPLVGKVEMKYSDLPTGGGEGEEPQEIGITCTK